MVETKYKDKEGKLIKVGTKLVDEENFLWEVKEDSNGLYIECEDLLARESVYPRAKYCKTKGV